MSAWRACLLIGVVLLGGGVVGKAEQSAEDRLATGPAERPQPSSGGVRIALSQPAVVIATQDPDVRLTVLEGGRSVKITDARDGQEVELDAAKLEILLGGEVASLQLRGGQLALKRDGKTIVVVRSGPVREPRAAPPAAPDRWEAVGEVRQFQGHQDHVVSVAMLPDGRRAMSASHDGTIRLWDVATGQQIRQIAAHGGQAYVAILSPDGRHILSGGRDGMVCLWDVESGREVRRYRHDGFVRALAFTPGGDRFLSATRVFGSPGMKGLVCVWETATGTEFGGFQQPMEIIHSLAVSRDGRRALCAGGYGSLSDAPLGPLARVWDLENDKTLFELKPNIRTSLRNAALSLDGRFVLATDVENRLAPAVWDVETGKQVCSFPGEQGHVVALYRDGRLALVGNNEGTVAAYNVERGKLVIRFKGHRGPVECLAFSPDGRYALSGGWDKLVRLWRVPAVSESAGEPPRLGGPNRRPEPARAGVAMHEPDPASPVIREVRKFLHDSYVYSVAIAPDGRRALSSSFDLTVRLWDVNSGRELRRFTGRRGSQIVNDLAWSPDGRYALFGCGQTLKTERIVLFDVEAWSDVREFPGLESIVRCVAFTPDGRYALAGTLEGLVHVWDVDGGRPISRYRPPVRGARSIAVLPDGKLAAYAGGFEDRRIRLWDILTGREARALGESFGEIRSMAASQDGRYVLAGGSGGMGLWDAGSGNLLRRMDPSESVGAVAFFPDGRWALAGGHSGTVRLWDVERGAQLHRFEGHTQQVTHLAVSPTARYALSSSYDSTVRMWPLPERPLDEIPKFRRASPPANALDRE